MSCKQNENGDFHKMHNKYHEVNRKLQIIQNQTLNFSSLSKAKIDDIEKSSKNVNYVEETMINLVDSSLKSLKFEIKYSEVIVLSDNHLYQFLYITSSQVIFSQKNNFNYFCDKTKVKLLKGFSELKIQDLIFYSTPEKIMLELPSFNISINDDIIYNYVNKEAIMNSFLSSEVFHY